MVVKCAIWIRRLLGNTWQCKEQRKKGLVRRHVQRKLVRTSRECAVCRPNVPGMSYGEGVQEVARKWEWDKLLLNHKRAGKGPGKGPGR